jgi:CheY-like chemotaxis protein
MRVPTILIADDDEDDVLLLKEVFETTDVLNPVQVVADGTQVIDYLEGTGVYADREAYPYPTLLFLDLNMPKMSGLELMEWLQPRRTQHPLGVIMLTGFSSADETKRAYELGVHSFLVKPLQYHDFTNLVSYLNGLQLHRLDVGYCLEFNSQGFGVSV